MTIRSQRIITSLLIALSIFGGFKALMDIVNLNQPVIYLQLAFWIFVYLVVMIVFLFDLHVKKPGSWQRARQRHENVPHVIKRTAKVVVSALWDRFAHLHSWTYVRQWLHFLLLPGFIFWATVSLFYVNLGDVKIQSLLAILSGLAIIVDFYFLKEAFFRRNETVDRDIFVALSMVKIYAAALLYGAALSILRYYCLNPLYFSLEVFCYTFLLIYQALYQHRLVNEKNIAAALGIAFVMGIAGQQVYIYWGYNYFTAAIFLAAIYNLLWGMFHYQLDHALTWRVFLEILIISAIVAGIVIANTNFSARILNDCQYYLN